MKTFITADWHLGESRFKIMSRPFSNQQEMIDAFVTNHNELVRPDDLVIVAGDVCYKEQPQFLEQVGRFNGNKILIRGNHDVGITDEEFSPYFEEIIPEGEGIEILHDDHLLYATHYPTMGREDVFNLVGHIHSGWRFQLNMMNVGVDVNHFRPVPLEDIPFYINAIDNFYDRDVWVAYDKINENYREIRGKKTTYFNPEG